MDVDVGKNEQKRKMETGELVVGVVVGKC